MLIFTEDHSAIDSRGRYRVIQKVSPRVVIVEPLGDATKEEMGTIEGVDVVLEPGERLVRDVSGAFSDAEMLFIEAYAQRSRDKRRLGDGLDWDADGFLPPDPPGNNN
ncbi:hypothetical protein [Bradyrhizobium sp.]|uniref:hypothetical protein n=1 Tax=Bradyrhizobium sp. TaxID=376 RepID=UPI002E0A8AB4|nr:hypothetical protein [Bradyrhizobium sp.]